jgi:hypothetical protein
MHIDDKSLYFNKIVYGFIAGLISPVLFFLLYFLFRFGQYSFADYWHILNESNKLVNVFSLSVLPNFVPFMLFINSNRYSAGRGVLAVTILLGVLIFILKFI